MGGRIVAGAVAGLTAACGVPTTSDPEVLSTTAVPYDLLSSSAATVVAPTTSPAGAQTTDLTTGQVAFVIADQVVRLEQRRVLDGSPAQVAQLLLTQLQAGPTEAEHRRGLGSVIPARAGLRVVSVAAGLATIDQASEAPTQATDQLPVAVAQIVLTATSVPSIHSVRLQVDGQPVAAPVAGGVLKSEPLTRRDFEVLLKKPTAGAS